MLIPLDAGDENKPFEDQLEKWNGNENTALL
jgi:hypothetical protein